MTGAPYRSGLVALIGRPNVGKSTLLNRLMGEKISIVSRRPQTTRYRILGIKTGTCEQIVYVDTPGVHAPEGRRLNRHLARLARVSVEGVDCVVLVIAATGWEPEDEAPLAIARALAVPVVLAINKIDRVRDRRRLLSLIRESAAQMTFAEVVPLSARTGENVDVLERLLRARLPEQPAIYPTDRVTDGSDRFRAQETVREQIYALYGQEVPHATAVEVTRFKPGKARLEMEAVIWVEREGQKPIVIGARGARLKEVGVRVRRELERRHGVKANVQLWVRVRKGWADDVRALQRLGLHDEIS